MMIVKMKKCYKCEVEKPLGNFSKDASRYNGFNNKCNSCMNKYQKEHRQKNRERYKNYTEKYCDENKEKLIEKRRLYFQKNKKLIYEKRKTPRKLRHKERLVSDPLYKISQSIRRLIRGSFRRKGFKKNSKTCYILGCSIEDFKIHIEKHFKEGMSWDNRSKWHIDHIIPLATAKTEEDIVRLNHYSNLRPLWADENIKKGAKILTSI